MLDTDNSDRSKLLAYLIDEAGRCGMCGTYEWEWTADRYAYEPAAKVCRGCQLLDMEREDHKPGPGTTMILIPKEKAQELREHRR